ncbi:MAG: hypothetical protein BroJett038_02230 [Chloroflexota bacterium]|jgi:hypothetical protein|nr:MAG: hypothetical protein BroJett038_02230 [Chloroflexota bacterium]
MAAMPDDNLPPDPDALAKWEKLPQNKPSKQALPPLAGGARRMWWALALLAGLALIALLQGRIG